MVCGRHSGVIPSLVGTAKQGAICFEKRLSFHYDERGKPYRGDDDHGQSP